jgi:hypothetical protein
MQQQQQYNVENSAVNPLSIFSLLLLVARSVVGASDTVYVEKHHYCCTGR